MNSTLKIPFQKTHFHFSFPVENQDRLNQGHKSKLWNWVFRWGSRGIPQQPHIQRAGQYLEWDHSLCAPPQATLKNRKKNKSWVQEIKFLGAFFRGKS